MSRLAPLAGLLAALAETSLAGAAPLEATQPRSAFAEVRIPLTGLPTTSQLGQYRVTARTPENPEDSLPGGSGGPIVELVVAGPRFKTPEVISIQAIRLYARDRRPHPPEFSVWSKTGVSSPVRCSLRPVGAKPAYCFTECQDYEIATQGMVPVGNPRPQPACP